MASTAFLESPRFPESISFGSQGGPKYLTDIIELKNGFESRNVVWTYPRHSYDVVYGLKRFSDIESVLDMFHAAGGRAYAFRYKDWADYKSCPSSASISATDQVLGNGDSLEVGFQLIKSYTKGNFSRSRKIQKVVTASLIVAVDGTTQASTSFSLNTTLGVITFTTNSIPGAGSTVTAGFEFDVPVRFDTDNFKISLDDKDDNHAFVANSRIPLIEIKLSTST